MTSGPNDSTDGDRPRVAVVGGGIAGMAAAWSLDRSGFPVRVFEKADALGGNARTQRWSLAQGSAESPVLVIAWPGRYYHNYHQLLDRLGLERRPIPIRYWIAHPDGVFRQDGESELDRRFADDFARWRRLIRFATRINDLFLGGDRRASLYHFSYWNPLNLIPLYRLCRAFGISSAFWRQIFVPVHVATLITTSMRDLPAVVAPLVESIVPLERPCEMTTWAGAPRAVFERMSESFRERVHTRCEIVSIRRERGRFVLEAATGERFEADRVVMACQAPAARRALEDANPFERFLLGRVQYVDDVDRSFARYRIHSDAGILPAADRERILRDFNTYVEVDESGRLECTFVLSAGNPNLRELGRPMLVTFNSRKPIADVVAEVELPNPTHTLSLRNLANMLLFRFVQGRRGVYYCSGYTTPEGAHDISFLSGLVVAGELGAEYPFADVPEALADYRQMQRLMLGRAR